MKTFMLLSVAGLLAIFSAAFSHAAEQGAERIDHYAAEKPQSKEAALSLLKEKMAAVATILEKNPLTGSDLEAVHEVSYSLEAAVEALRAYQDKEKEAALDALDETVQAVHFASEHHDATKTREWFSKMTVAHTRVNEVF